MASSAQSASKSAVTLCCICARPVPLETSKTDERGKAVHEACYVRRTVSKFKLAITVHLPEDWRDSSWCDSNLDFEWAYSR